MSGLLEENAQDARRGEAGPKTTQQAFRALLDPYLDGSSDATLLLDLLRSDDSASSYVQSVIAAKKEQLAASYSP